MSGAQSWSVKGIDPKVREAAREAAARQGMSLGEYLSQALNNIHTGAPPSAQAPAHAPTQSYAGARTRPSRFAAVAVPGGRATGAQRSNGAGITIS